MTQVIQPQRQPLGTFQAPNGAEVPVYITVPWFRALNQLASAPAPSPTPAPPSSSVTIDDTPGFQFGSLLFNSQPNVLHRINTGDAGTILTSNGPGNAPEWVGAPAATLAPIAPGSMLANTAGGAAAPVGTALTALLDAVLGVNQGSIVFRDAASWVALTPSVAGYVLTTGGAGASPAWAPAATGGGSFSYSSSAPGSPNPGDAWVDSDTGIFYTYINDGDSSQWVEF